jgi:hypothetical protein
MKRNRLCFGLLLLSGFPSAALGQTESSMPSKDEIFELLDKADQKISIFEDAVRSAKPKLDGIDQQISKNYLDAASTSHVMIRALHKNGPSAHALVGLLATIDDLSLDAANASVKLLDPTRGQPPDGSVVASVILLSSSGAACNDIAELIMHATLRLIHVEEELIQSLPNQK